MSDFKIHIMTGLITAFFFSLILYSAELLTINRLVLTQIIVVSLLFSIISDIDSKNSKISNILILITLGYILLLLSDSITFNYTSLLVVAGLLYLNYYNYKYSKKHHTHRQLPHTFTFGLVTSFFVLIATSNISISAIALLVFISHIILDYKNKLNKIFDLDKKLWSDILEQKSIRTNKIYFKLSPEQEKLYEAIRKQRLEWSKEKKVSAYIVFSNKTIYDIIEKMPRNYDELLNINGIGVEKKELYGERLISILDQHR